MSWLRVIDQNGVEHRVDATPGLKVMEVLRDLEYGVPAICGGMLSCGTCHVYVDTEWVRKLPETGMDERELLAQLDHYDRQHSRLSCQIEFTDELAGLRVTIAPED